MRSEERGVYYLPTPTVCIPGQLAFGYSLW